MGNHRAVHTGLAVWRWGLLGGLLGLLWAMGLATQPALSAAPGTAGPPPGLQGLHADSSGLTWEWSGPEITARQVTGDDGRAYSALAAPGWDWSATPGAPQLPLASVLIVAPPTGTPALTVAVQEQATVPLDAPPLPALRTVLINTPATGLTSRWEYDARAYTPSAASPAWVTWEEAGTLRGSRLIRLTFNPVRYDPAQLALTVARRVHVAVAFAAVSTAKVPPAADDPFAALVRQVVINPGQVGEFTHYATSAVQAAGAPTDTQYLIISHASFITAVTPLATQHTLSDGLRVYMTTTQAIQSLYSGVVMSTAIRNYISATYHSVAPPTLQYVLLVGDGSERITDPQYVPPYIIPDPWNEIPGGAASDNRYVTMDGPTDQVADIFIGRLPVNSVAQATTVVQKLLDYRQHPPQWPWNQQILFFAGHEGDVTETFHDDSDWIYTWLYATLPPTTTIQSHRVYFCTADCNQSYKYTSISTARARLMDIFNSGGLIASYVGHGSQHQWDYDPEFYAPLLHRDDVAQLHNGGALPVVLGLSCFTSRFSDPAGDTLDETLLRRAGGGAIATWGGTTLGLSSGHRVLHQRFFEAVFKYNNLRLGPATEFAKLGLPSSYLDLRDTFLLLGDPALSLNMTVVPWSQHLFLPLVMRQH